MNYGFDNFEKANLANKNLFIDNIQIVDGVNPIVAGILKDDLCITVPKSSIDKIDRRVLIDKKIEAPIKKNQTIGKVEYYLKDQLLGEVDIISTLDIEKKPPKSNFKKVLSKWYILIIPLLIIMKISTNIKQKQRKRRKTSMYHPRNF